MGKTLTKSYQDSHSLSQPPELTEIERLKLRARAGLELKNRETYEFRGFIQKVEPHFTWYQHSSVLANALERVRAGEIKRLMIFEPPQHGKTLLCSRLFPAYMLDRSPRTRIGLISYADAVAYANSRAARDYYQAAERDIRSDAGAIDEWHTVRGGQLWAAGIGGVITSRGFDLAIVDDPLKGLAEAMSMPLRMKQREWWDSVFWTRKTVNTAIIVVMTRWHEADLAGWLLERELDSPEHWHIISFEGLKTDTPQKFPETCTVEPDWRNPGEALCEARTTKRELEVLQKRNARIFISLYQQRPAAAAGEIWKLEWFEDRRFELEHILDPEHPKHIELENIGYDWDGNYTKKEENSACAYVKAGKHGEDIYILDVDWRWVEFPAMVRWMKEKGPNYVENKASGKSAVQVLKEQGVHAQEVAVGGTDKSGGDKIGRAKLASVAAEGGHVYIANHIWDKLLFDMRQGLLLFPKSEHDDVNDMVVQAINRLRPPGHFWFYVGADKEAEKPKIREEVQPEQTAQLVLDDAGNLVPKKNGKRNGAKKKGVK